ncbi:MAG: hypothetical protein K8U03_13850 [Planctomycetia bacterium]|nr:hypothetical protein [Planctomycetia bacterium]
MALEPREKKLAAVVAALGLVTVAWLGRQSFDEAMQLRRGQIESLTKEVQKKRLFIARAGLDNERLATWEEKSLPRDAELARSLYQNWLVGTVDRAQLTQVNVEPGRSTQLRGIYTKLPFTLRARGTLAQVAAWLATFYRADHLHQLRDVSLQPALDGGGVQLTAGIEALAVDDATRADTLNTTTGSKLDEARGTELAQAIVARNVFAPYVPPPPAVPPKIAVEAIPPAPPAFDPAKFTFLTSIIFVDFKPQAWLNVRPTNQLLKLSVGDAVEVGQFSGKLVRIGDQEIEIDSAGKRRIVSLGKSLGQAVELPAAPL